MIDDYLIGDTIQFTWISSGVAPSDLYCTVMDGDETSVDSATMASSGNGHYYHHHTVTNTPGYYVGRMVANINGDPFIRTKRFRGVTEEVD